MRLLIIGNREGTNVGGCFERAAAQLGIATRLFEMRLAWEGPTWRRRVAWYLGDKLPPRTHAFGSAVVDLCQQWRPDCVLTTGVSPLTVATLQMLGALGVWRVNFSTDDPWNPTQYARWFLKTLPHYDLIYTPRHANIADFKAMGCSDVRYLPFAYDPALHYPEQPTPNTQARYTADVVFVGSADADRVPFISALTDAGLQVALYGTYWERFKPTRRYSRGKAAVSEMRYATGAAAINLCLVRRANRDGHVMRSFEIAAMRGCLLAEDTAEHRAIFGTEGVAALYFASPEAMVTKARWLLAHPQERQHMADHARQVVVRGEHSYAHRLATMLQAIPENTFSTI